MRLNPRHLALVGLFMLLGAVLLLCLFFAKRTRRPGVVWGVGAYYLSLLSVFIYGLASSTHFETAFAQLTLLTFPLSILTDHTLEQEGFATLQEIAHNFVRYVLLYASFDGLLLLGLFRMLFPARDTFRSAHR